MEILINTLAQRIANVFKGRQKIIAGLVLGAFVVSCTELSERERAIQAIDINVNVDRFDRAFAQAQPKDLDSIKRAYPLFFPTQYPDSVWIAKMNDTLQRAIQQEVLGVFADDALLSESCSDLFRHIKYDFPNFVLPNVVATTSDVDYKTRILAHQGWLILMLDNYLGSEHKFYAGLPRYVAKNLRPEMLFSDVATAFGRKFVASPTERNFLAQMIYYGKLLYLKDLWLPEMSDADKIGYTQEELEWAIDNEYFIWQYFLTQEYLFSTNSRLKNRFIDPAPYSKFNLELDNETPGMIGQWIGWQIVRQYMQNNATDLGALMRLPAQELYNQAQYKPAK